MKVFIDSGAWLALEITADIYHEKARKQVEILKKQRALLFTNSFILSETYTRLIYDVNLNAARKFHQSILEGTEHNLTILEVDQVVRENAWKELFRYFDHPLSFTDATIVAQFKAYNLDEIFTFDKHFRDIHLPTNI
ncbi:type II toxin-antitoxin system VapC family toxin [Candidatus Gottesmanbacteria bacterium]|nr:type II toxin-antitoxin system VapC family toxin [Candidatus Gottesmanbacteria bacterium]